MRLEQGWGTPDPHALEEFLVHGVKYVFAATRGGLTLGIPTSHAAPPLNRLLASRDEPPPVWPDESGAVRGHELLAVVQIGAGGRAARCEVVRAAGAGGRDSGRQRARA